MTLGRLPIIVPPRPQEFPVAWLARLAFQHQSPIGGLANFMELSSFAPLCSTDLKSAGVMAIWFQIFECTRVSPMKFHEFYRNRHIFTIGRDVYLEGAIEPGASMAFISGLSVWICPLCCLEKGFMDKKSISTYAVVCVDHEAVLLNYCTDCGNRIRLPRIYEVSYLSCVDCGLQYSEMKTQNASRNSLVYQKKIYEEELSGDSSHTKFLLDAVIYRHQSKVWDAIYAYKENFQNFRYYRPFLTRLNLLSAIGDLYIKHDENLNLVKNEMFGVNRSKKLKIR
ncbi:hypothetical protein [Deinococcus koreensis]|uniref:hypothetical protein n=1 Tax=Deinococcus koreensis TaxID=2054903 RepID=UPI0010573733|nr:hypothetical protein [Deinococcus koreensis]